jgi:hypothetical protein
MTKGNSSSRPIKAVFYNGQTDEPVKTISGVHVRTMALAAADHLQCDHYSTSRVPVRVCDIIDSRTGRLRRVLKLQTRPFEVLIKYKDDPTKEENQ